MVPVWKEKIRLNAVFVNNYKKCFVTAIEVCIALNIWIYLILCPWLGLPYNINSSKSWRLDLIMIFLWLKNELSYMIHTQEFENNNDKQLNSTEFAQLKHVAVSVNPCLYISAINILTMYYLLHVFTCPKIKKVITFPTKIWIQ